MEHRRILEQILLVLHIASSCHGLAAIPTVNHEILAAEAPTISSSHFLLGNDGWDVLGKGVKTGICLFSLCVEDFGNSVWYRRAPDGFLGNVSDAFGGILIAEMGFFEINRAGRAGFQEEEGMRFDVILENHKHNMRIGVPDLFSVGSFSVNLELPLSEAGGWLHIKDGRKATNQEIRTVLSSLANLLMRGGHYSGPEHTYMRRVLMRGPPPPASHRPSAEGISATETSPRQEPVSIPAQKQAGESALQRALRERSLAPEKPQVVIHIGGDNHMSGVGIPESQVVSYTDKEQELEGGDQKQQKSKKEHDPQRHQQTPKQRMENLAHLQREAQNEAQNRRRHALACFDDGSHLPVTQLIRSAQASNSQLIACLSSRDGAFSVSLDRLSFASAEAGSTMQVVRLDSIHGVNVSDDDGYVVVSSKDDGVVIKGCKMKSFDMDELAAFFETVQDFVDSHQPL